MLVSAKAMLDKAKAEHYAVGAFQYQRSGVDVKLF